MISCRVLLIQTIPLVKTYTNRIIANPLDNLAIESQALFCQDCRVKTVEDA